MFTVAFLTMATAPLFHGASRQDDRARLETELLRLHNYSRELEATSAATGKKARADIDKDSFRSRLMASIGLPPLSYNRPRAGREAVLWPNMHAIFLRSFAPSSFSTASPLDYARIRLMHLEEDRTLNKLDERHLFSLSHAEALLAVIEEQSGVDSFTEVYQHEALLNFALAYQRCGCLRFEDDIAKLKPGDPWPENANKFAHPAVTRVWEELGRRRGMLFREMRESANGCSEPKRLQDAQSFFIAHNLDRANAKKE